MDEPASPPTQADSVAKVRAPMRCLLPLSFALLLAACPGPVATDGGTMADSGVNDSGVVEGPTCNTSKDCKLAAYDGVCRSKKCTGLALCTDDVECGLGENCLEGVCKFTGCARNSDCATGSCRTDVFACAECGANSDCPSTRPVCDGSNKCVQCGSDAQCSSPGPAHCDAPSGACVHCLEDKHCPNGLSCAAGHICTGAKLNAACTTVPFAPPWLASVKVLSTVVREPVDPFGVYGDYAPVLPITARFSCQYAYDCNGLVRLRPLLTTAAAEGRALSGASLRTGPSYRSRLGFAPDAEQAKRAAEQCAGERARGA